MRLVRIWLLKCALFAIRKDILIILKSYLLEVFDFGLTSSRILDHCLIILSSFKLTACSSEKFTRADNEYAQLNANLKQYQEIATCYSKRASAFLVVSLNGYNPMHKRRQMLSCTTIFTLTVNLYNSTVWHKSTTDWQCHNIVKEGLI